MATSSIPDQLRKHEIPGRVRVAAGNGGLPKINITTKVSAAEIYLLGAHVTGFQKTGEPPLLFMSGKSWFAPGKPIRGGVPVCFPWFGAREGERGARLRAQHGLGARKNRRCAGRFGDADFSPAGNSRTPRLEKSADGICRDRFRQADDGIDRRRIIRRQ